MSMSDWFKRNWEAERAARRCLVCLKPPTECACLPLSEVLAKPKPKLATVRNAPSRDEFAAWRQDPTTAFVMAALLRNAVECEDKWFIDSWEAGKADQRTLDGLRERADALRGIAEADYEAFCETLGLEPEPLHGDAA